jgi:ubiquinone/menaquinone biosynthesis C-methylase UbiE
MTLWAWALVALALVALLYWLLIATEGTYLGTGVVVRLYDWTAHRYDRIKAMDYVDEARFLGIPLAERLAGIAVPQVLDVASGTGRIPLALLGQWDFAGSVVGVDRSGPMLAEAARSLADFGDRATLIRADAAALPFGDAAFDAVCCLESLEFMTDPRAVVRAMMRVLKPGGVLLVSNRVGPDARWLPGRLCGRGRLERALAEAGFAEIDSQRWQFHYDLIWADKPVATATNPLRAHIEDGRAEGPPGRSNGIVGDAIANGKE